MRFHLARKVYLFARDIIMQRSGLQPKGIYVYSANNNNVFDLTEPIKLPNLSGELRSALYNYMRMHGLGKKCLLVSENYAVKDTMKEYFSDVDFQVSDYFSDLMDGDEGIDFVWDVCCKPPDNLSCLSFDSIISQSLLEHTIAPTIALINFFQLLAPNGMLYLSTHTPSFHYHAYPRDYVRFHHDYFFDMAEQIKKIAGLRIELLELYSTKGVICACYQKH